MTWFATWCLAWFGSWLVAAQQGAEAAPAQAVPLAEPEVSALEAELRGDSRQFQALKQLFESRNPGHYLKWMPATERLQVKVPLVAFFQSNGDVVQLPPTAAAANGSQSAYSIGDILCLPVGQSCSFDPPADLLVFQLPQAIAADLPQLIRPDWDPNITDTPGGCATEGDAYRRILLTWQGKNGPYLSHQINAHRVRIHDSFTHYHPLVGGFDEFYLVQEAPPGATLLVSEHLDRMLDPKGLTANHASQLMREIPLQQDDLIYLPRGVVHRGLGGAVVQVITIPGFVPGAEIPVDDEIRHINQKLKLSGDRALPCHKGVHYVEVRPRKASVEAVAGADNSESEIFIGGKPFTTLRTDRRLPDLWPVFNSAGNGVTRTWPRTPVVSGQSGAADATAAASKERHDHPHHQSMWFAHGKMNGIDFWHDKKASVVQVALDRQSGDGRGWVESRNQWLYDGKLIAQDHRRVDGFVDGDVRGLDFDITLAAGADGLLFADTKEGTFALRMAAGLVHDKGAELLNDRGMSGGKVWGQKARWIQSNGSSGGKDAAVVIAGHRSNPRHPTFWHARKYGLLAANPFGVHDFTKAGAGSGDMKIEAGETVRFRYRVLVFARHPSADEVEKLLLGFTSPRSETRPSKR